MKDSKEINIYLNIVKIRKFCQVILGTTLCLFVSLIIFTVIYFANLIFWPDILLTILFWLFLGFVFAFSFTDDPCNLIKPGFVAFGHIIFIIMVYFLSIFYHYNFANVFPIAYVLSLGLFIALCISLGLTLTANTYVLVFRRKYKKKNPKLFRVYRTRKIKKALIICIGITGVSCWILATPTVLQIPITIEPQDYQAKIAFWGGYGLNDSEICESLDKHKVDLIQCCFDDIYDKKGKENFIKNTAYYNNTYPNISIYFSVTANPGAFVWDGNMEQIVDKAKDLVKIIQENNLTNVKGLAFDIEQPYFPYFGFIPTEYEAMPDRERHDESIEIWYDFFDWMDKNAPDLELNAINYVEGAIDTFDGDYDLHYIRRFSFFDLKGDNFDEYAPMSYRGMYMGQQPYGDSMENPVVRYSDGGHYWMYTQLDMLSKAMDEKFGNHKKMGVYLGITNCTCYGADYKQYQNGKPAGYGYDNLVRDALIAKHFGVKTITIFLLTTVIENGYSMGGVFDSYGKDFLDDFNESINGEDAPDFFQIWYKPRFNYILTFGHVDGFVFDSYSNLDSFLGILYVSIIIVVNALIALYGWKQIKTKVLEYDRKKKEEIASK